MDLETLKREWVYEDRGNGEQYAKMWDGRAEDFIRKPIPDIHENGFLACLWEKAKPAKNCEVLDIGCGAGQYSLALAPFVAETVGTDVSPVMIEAARRRAAEEGIENSEFIAEDWGQADIGEKDWESRFDIVFAHMTPAICDYHTLDLMNRCAAGHCFLVKPTRRSDEIMDGAFGEVGLPRKADELDMTVLNTFNYLWLKGITPEVTSKKEIWTMERSVEKMTAWCIDQASLRKELTSEEKERIHGFVEKRSVGGTVTEKVETTVVTVYWDVQ